MSSHKQPVPSVSSSVSVSESLAATVQTLVHLNEAEFLASLTPDSYQQLTAVQAALSTVVGEDENHLFAPLATFITNLIKNHVDSPKILASDKVRPVRGHAEEANADEPDYTADMLISVNPHYEDPSETWNGDARPVRGHAEEANEDEPDYTADMLISVNPHYEDPSETWNSGARPMRGHAEEANEDEPEYTADMLISVNPHYEDPSETWNSGARPVRGRAENANEDEHDLRTKPLTKWRESIEGVS